jgi:shikimate dehydrogenase
LGHSVSPAFQQAAFDYHHMNVKFERWEVSEDKLRDTVNGLRDSNVLGASVTVPYKEAVQAYLDQLSREAEQTGAVNLIVNRDGILEGHNTDVSGFLRALLDDGAFEPCGKEVLLLGSGGAARAIASALLGKSVSSLIIANRTIERANKLVTDLGGGPKLSAISLETSGLTRGDRWNLIVNSTTVGMRYTSLEGESPISSKMILPGTLVYDLVYNPEMTPLLKNAREAGAKILGGLPMLIYQGSEAFQLWTGREAPLSVMFRSARDALV